MKSFSLFHIIFALGAIDFKIYAVTPLYTKIEDPMKIANIQIALSTEFDIHSHLNNSTVYSTISTYTYSFFLYYMLKLRHLY